VANSRTGPVAVSGPGTYSAAAGFTRQDSGPGRDPAVPSRIVDARSVARPDNDPKRQACGSTELRQAAMKPAEGPVPCLCGHDHIAHRHYRPRSECSLCECPRWRPKRGLRRLAVLVLDRLSKLSAKPEGHRSNHDRHSIGRSDCRRGRAHGGCDSDCHPRAS
jgi:hypothetical protein